MKIIIDIGHPAHVHLFKHFAWKMIKDGHEILFTTREKEFEIDLLKEYGFNFKTFGSHYSTKKGKIWGLLKFDYKLFFAALKFKPDLFLSHGSIYAAHVSFLLHKPHISLEDSGNMEQIRIYKPFTKIILSPNVLPEDLGSKQIKYNGYHELTYLLPNYFKPNMSIYQELGINENEKFCVMRFVSWKATHDIGQGGLSLDEKREIVEKLSRKLRIFISSEGELPDVFKQYKIDISPESMHQALNFAELFVGEGATMASEAGVLGTPALYINTLVRQYNEDQEKYGLVFNFRNGIGVIEKIDEILNIPNLKQEFQKRKINMLKEKIDVTAFLIWFIKNYPNSADKLKNNPGYQWNFRYGFPKYKGIQNSSNYIKPFKDEKRGQKDATRAINHTNLMIGSKEYENNNQKEKLNILVDIGHPAHVHLFRNFIEVTRNKGHKVLITAKNIPSTKLLLEKYNFDYLDIGSKADSIRGKLFRQLHFNKLLYQIVKREKIKIGVGTSITLAHVSKISKMKSIIFDDDDSIVEPLFKKFAQPFADYLLSPDVLKYERKKKNHFVYAGFHELAYLHPKRFKPDPSILKELNLKINEKFFLLRFNAFKAHHDVGVEGLNLGKKRKLINLLKNKGKIFITTEEEIDPEFKQYQLKAVSEKIHSLIYYATMLIGDSQTMTSEAAVLGTPAIRSNSFVGKISYLEEEEHKYELTYGFKPDDFEKMLTKINELLKMPDLKPEWQKRKEKMLGDKIDVTAFMVWFVENFPESVEIMKKNPDYQLKFK